MNERALKGIVIDAGHGGSDGGATGNGIVEKVLTLEISNYMNQRFQELGVPVAMTRTTDIELDSTTRPKKALDAFGSTKDVLVISNHINAGGGEGAEVIYALRNSSALSEKILNNLAQEGQTIRKYYQRRLPSNPSKDYYYMLRETPNTEAIIVEYGFLDNVNDATKLKANYKDYAEAVIRAVMEYKGLKYTPPKGSTNYYVVKAGDTLWTIAKNNGISVNELKQINNLSNNSLSIGQILKLNTNNEQTDKEDISNNIYHQVTKGDTLYSLAQKYNTSVTNIKKLNNLSNNNLSIGQNLLIKSSTPTMENIYIVKRGDNLYSIAKNYNTTVDEIKKLNNLSSNNLSIGQTLIIPDIEEYQTYIVVPGDTLYAIALKYNTSIDAIKNLNNLATNLLSVGQKLLIP